MSEKTRADPLPAATASPAMGRPLGRAAEAEVEHLLDGLELGEGFEWALVTGRSPELRTEVARRLAAVSALLCEPPGPDLLTRIEARLQGTPSRGRAGAARPVLWVEHGSTSPAVWSETLARLNQDRDWLRTHVAALLVLAGNPELEQLAAQRPDIWSTVGPVVRLGERSGEFLYDWFLYAPYAARHIAGEVAEALVAHGERVFVDATGGRSALRSGGATDLARAGSRALVALVSGPGCLDEEQIAHALRLGRSWVHSHLNLVACLDPATETPPRLADVRRVRGEPPADAAGLARALLEEVRSLRGPAASPDAPLLAGRYRRHRMRGAGEVATSWLCHDTRLGRAVSAKILHPHLAASPTVVRDFLEAARRSTLLRHPAVERVLDYGIDPDAGPFLIAGSHEGDALREVAQHVSLDAERAARLIVGLGAGLQAAHEAGVVHGDVNPASVRLDMAGHARLVDFGLGALASRAELTSTGTVRFGAPEVLVAGPAAVTPSADQYGLAATMLFLLLGHDPPLWRRSVDEILSGSQVPEHLRPVLARALSQAPEHRYPSIAAFCEAVGTGRGAPSGLLEFVTMGALPPGSPLFVGRTRELDRVTSEIRDRSFLIAGPRRSGKTSFLHALLHRLAAEPDLDPVRVDLLGVQTREQVGRLFSRPASRAADAALPVYLADGAEALVQHDPAAVSELRAMDEAGEARFVLTMTSRPDRGHVTSPLRHWLSPIVLGPLEDAAAADLVDRLTAASTGLSWRSQVDRQQVRAVLLERSYRLPWLLQELCLLVQLDRYGRGEARIAAEDVERVVVDADDAVWRALDPVSVGPVAAWVAAVTARALGFTSSAEAEGDFSVDDAVEAVAASTDTGPTLDRVEVARLLRALTATPILEPSHGGPDRFAFTDDIYPRELTRRFGASGLRLDGYLRELAAAAGANRP